MRKLSAALILGSLVVSGTRLASADNLSAMAAASFDIKDDYVTGLAAVTSFVFLPDGRMVITQKAGQVIVRDAAGAKTNAGSFTVDNDSEKGLLNVVPHPAFMSNGLLLFYYSRAGAGADFNLDRHRVVSVKLGANNMLDMATEKILVSGLRGPANHDGGALAIGPDGMLYIGVGDTGCNSNRQTEPAYTPTNFFATCLTNGNGKILRVNPDTGKAPPDNPLVGKTVTACGSACAQNPGSNTAASRDDIWAWGFRNPWRFSFDAKTGNLWVGDVGEITYEEINVIPQSQKGKHFGWPWREGTHGNPAASCETATPGSGDCVEPKYFCRHPGVGDPAVDAECRSITGGVIVDSCQWPADARGRYFFADNAGDGPRKLWSVALTADRGGITPGSRQEIATATGGIVHIDVGPDGALYYASHNNHITRITTKTQEMCSGSAGAGGAGGAGGAAGGAGGAAGGVAGASGGAAGAAGNGGTASAKPGGSDDDGGCGCRAPRNPANGAAALLLLAGSLALARRWKSSKR